jgi:hypothetical protein
MTTDNTHNDAKPDDRTNISLFCSTVEYKTPYLKPWVRDGYECATDGQSLAFRRVNLPDDYHEDAPNVSAAIDLVLSSVCDREFPRVPPQPVCSFCQGKGWLPFCDTCDGSGESTCPECGGPTICEDCDGSGEGDGRCKCTRCIDGFQVKDLDGNELRYVLPETDLLVSLRAAKRLSDLRAMYAIVANTTTLSAERFCIWQAGNLKGLTPVESAVETQWEDNTCA